MSQLLSENVTTCPKMSQLLNLAQNPKMSQLSPKMSQLCPKMTQLRVRKCHNFFCPKMSQLPV